MAVLSIHRDLGEPSIVRFTTDDTLADILATDYVLNHTTEINALNNGGWTWLASDVVAVSATDGHQIVTFTGSDFNTFVALNGGANFVAPVTSNTVVTTAGDGTFADSGMQIVTDKWIDAGGSAVVVVTNALVQATSIVVGSWLSQTNPGQVVTIVPDAGFFTVTSTADVGFAMFQYASFNFPIGP